MANYVHMIESLQTGRFGIALRLPPHLEVLNDDEERADLEDETKGVICSFFFFPDLHLDLCEEYRADLRKSLGHYARSIFDYVFRKEEHMDSRLPPRTEDMSWSPLVDVEHLSIGGAQALRTVHRTAYEPGRQSVMGHLLIPLLRGLFEARVFCVDFMTGYRESVLLAKLLRERPPNGEEDLKRLMAFVQQPHIDDPRHDDDFPKHALSRTRAALRRLIADSGLRVSELPSPIQHGEVVLSHTGCALVPPPRFVYERSADRSGGWFCRVSFCGTDGVERLHVHQWRVNSRVLASDLPRVAESLARKLAESSDIQDLNVTVEILRPLDERPQTLVVVEGKGHLGLLRHAMIFFLDENGGIWSISIYGIEPIPRDSPVADLARSVRSFRLVHSHKQRKP